MNDEERRNQLPLGEATFELRRCERLTLFGGERHSLARTNAIHHSRNAFDHRSHKITIHRIRFGIAGAVFVRQCMSHDRK